MTSSTRQTAICSATNAWRRLQRRPPIDRPRPRPASSPSTLDRVPVHAGISPAAMPAPSATATDSASTLPFSDRSSATGTSSDTRTAPSPCRRPQARATPPATPSNASITLSTSNCRSRRPRLAPTARRRPISRPRVDARASRSPATFAQAISSTSPMSTRRLSAPARRRSSNIGWVDTSPVGITVTRSPSFESGYVASSPRITPFRSSVAPPAVSPSRRRPLTSIQCSPRLSSRVAPGAGDPLCITVGWTSSTRAIGIQNAGVRMGGVMPPKLPGATPTMA